MSRLSLDNIHKEYLIHKFSLLKQANPNRKYPDNVNSLDLSELNESYAHCILEIKADMIFNNLKLTYTMFLLKIEYVYIKILHDKSKIGFVSIELSELNNYTRIEQLQDKIIYIFQQLKEDCTDYINNVSSVNDSIFDFYERLMAVDINIDAICNFIIKDSGMIGTKTCIIS